MKTIEEMEERMWHNAIDGYMLAMDKQAEVIVEKEKQLNSIMESRFVRLYLFIKRMFTWFR